jgi:hypothetical protein
MAEPLRLEPTTCAAMDAQEVDMGASSPDGPGEPPCHALLRGQRERPPRGLRWHT